VKTLSRSFLLCILTLSGQPAFGQHLGDVMCKADTVFEGTITDVEQERQTDGKLKYSITAEADRVMKGSAGSTVRVTVVTAAPANHLQPKSRWVFLTSNGSLLRIEPIEHLAVIKNLIEDRARCR
jgi:hypothetical protein